MPPASTRTWTAAALAAAGFVVGLLGLLLNWWTVSVEAVDARGETQIDQTLFDARPYASDGRSSRFFGPLNVFDEALDDHVRVAGVLLTVALALQVAGLVAHLAGFLRPSLPAWPPHAAAALAALLGFVAALLAAFTWPAAWDAHLATVGGSDANDFPPASWTGRDRIGTEGGATAYAVYGPGSGWVLTLVGFVAFPLASGAARYWPARRAGPGPTASYLPAAPAPPPLPPGSRNPRPALRPASSAAGPARRLHLVSRATRPDSTQQPPERKKAKP